MLDMSLKKIINLRLQPQLISMLGMSLKKIINMINSRLQPQLPGDIELITSLVPFFQTNIHWLDRRPVTIAPLDTSARLLMWRPLPVEMGTSAPSQVSSRHYGDVIMSVVASQITSVSIVCSTVCLGANQRKHESSASLALNVRGIHQWPLDSPHKGPVTRKMFPFDDVIMITLEVLLGIENRPGI